MLKGNAIVGQSGGPTAAINATLAGVIRGVAQTDAIGVLYGMRNGIDGFLADRLVNLSEAVKGDEALSLLENTPAAALGSCRKKLPAPESDGADAVYARLLKQFRTYNIRYFFYIGGNDSMDTTAKLSAFSKRADWEMRIIGIPKTIDNDLMGTDHTPGFGSAAKYIAVTVQEILRDTAVYTVPAVTIVEIMGRDAGWLTAASALGRSAGMQEPDLIYLPERVFSMEQFLGDVRTALSRHPNVVVAVSEGIRFADGTYVGAGTQSGAADVFGHKYLAGTAKALEMAVKAEIGCKVRSVELNLPQRCASHMASAQDLAESVAVGKEAVRAAVEGVSCEMMTIQRTGNDPYTYRIGHADVEQIANRIKYVDDAFINEAGNGVTDACVAYLAPLIAGECYPTYRNGLPVHFIMP
ncbi:6-phosphofructokinase [Clostridium sp. CAG:448]|nr:6-phosphofructokinase [Clostridium sp. CAG:448]